MTELFLQMLKMSIWAGWVVLAVLFLRCFFRKAPKWITVLLWGIVAVRLICPFSIKSTVSLIPGKIGSGAVVENWADDYVGEIRIIHENSSEYEKAVTAGRVPVFTEEEGTYVVTKGETLEEASTIKTAVLPILTNIWLIGVIVMLLYTAVTSVRLHRKISTAVSCHENIFQSEYISSPFVLGVIAPKIYLPFSITEADIPYVVAHERAHISRKDHWWKPFGFFLLAIYWFQPLLWIAYALFCRDLELACDEKVIRDLSSEKRAEYSQALLKCSVQSRKMNACPLAFGEVCVKERIKAVMNYKKRGFAVAAFAVIICGITAVCCLTAPEKENSKEIIMETPELETAGEEEGKNVTKKAPDEDKITKEEEPLEAAITAALMENYDPDTLDGLLRVESHVILSNEIKNDADGNAMEETVYLLALLRKYQMYDKTILVIGESYVPTAITFSVNGSEGYVLKEYWTPRDGSYYVEDVREKFPQSAAEDALHEDRYISELQSESYQKALDGFFAKGSLKERIGELLETICSSAKETSAVKDYIEAHQQEYKELVEYEEYSLCYCFEEFLKGGQTDLRGKLMEQLCIDIMDSWGMAHHDVAYDTGQDWFETFYGNVMKLSDQYDDEILEKNYPAAWILLKLLRETDYPKEQVLKLF